MSILTLLAMLLIQPKAAFACVEHTASQGGTAFDSPAVFLLKMAFLFIATVPLGFVAGLAVKRFSSAGKAAALILVVSSLLMIGGYRAWACHGVTIVGPILEQIQKAQVSYRAVNGVYAATFEQLEVTPSADKYSYFLPAEMIPASTLFPKKGVDLSHLPEGVFSRATADNFTVVAIGFAEPNSLEIWTMNQDKVFKEWSVPAGAKVQSDPSVPAQQLASNATTPFEGSLAWMIFFVGCTIGFAFSVRNRMDFMQPT
jgi:hypothetical protein